MNLKRILPAGSQSGKVFRLRGKGVTTVRDRRTGDLFARVLVETPVNLTDEQEASELVRLAQEENSKNAGKNLGYLAGHERALKARK